MRNSHDGVSALIEEDRGLGEIVNRPVSEWLGSAFNVMHKRAEFGLARRNERRAKFGEIRVRYQSHAGMMPHFWAGVWDATVVGRCKNISILEHN
jgi:hypothetical protein